MAPNGKHYCQNIPVDNTGGGTGGSVSGTGSGPRGGGAGGGTGAGGTKDLGCSCSSLATLELLALSLLWRRKSWQAAETR
jgi:hypothetical protein